MKKNSNLMKLRYVRFHPITWHKRIGMRAAILGCRHSGECGEGFMQVNSGSACGKLLGLDFLFVFFCFI